MGQCLDQNDASPLVPFTAVFELTTDNVDAFQEWRVVLMCLSVVCSYLTVYLDFVVELLHFESTHKMDTLAQVRPFHLLLLIQLVTTTNQHFKLFTDNFCNFANLLHNCLFVDIGSEYLPFLEPKCILLNEDMELLGCTPFKRCHMDHFAKTAHDIHCYDVEEDSLQVQDANAIMLERCRRVLVFAKKMAANQVCVMDNCEMQ
jgi:hypothetical protein